VSVNKYLKTTKQYLKKVLTDTVVQIEPTRRCNFNCVHCTHKDNEGYIDIEVYRNILLNHSECKIVKLQGLGEPLLHPKIQDVIDIAKDLGHKVMIITNGSCHYVEHVDYYVFSLETMNPDIYEALGKRYLSKVIENIRYAASKQQVIINCVQCYKSNPKDVSDVKQFAKEIGADIWITPQEVWVDALHEDHAEQLEKTKLAWRIHGIKPDYKKYRVCNWGVGEYYYDYTGASHPCCIRMTDEYKNAKPSQDICSNCPL
jgi:MoaA/NifB/PqqE/SkfB family radical SAM enzyme